LLFATLIAGCHYSFAFITRPADYAAAGHRRHYSFSPLIATDTVFITVICFQPAAISATLTIATPAIRRLAPDAFIRQLQRSAMPAAAVSLFRQLSIISGIAAEGHITAADAAPLMPPPPLFSPRFDLVQLRHATPHSQKADEGPSG
jgi:hypothetical protein